MESKELPAGSTNKKTLTPKAVIFQKYGSNACYKVEEVRESDQSEIGLIVPQKGPCLYRCTLQLPELSVVSEPSKKKKDAEQSAAEMAIEKLGINTRMIDPTPQEAWESLVARISHLFSDKFLSCLHPLSGHIGAALQRKGDLCGSIPVSVIAVYDPKICNLCKFINPAVESYPFLVILYIMRASMKLSEYLATSERCLWIRKQSPYPQEIIESLMTEGISLEDIQVAAIRIPSSVEKYVEAINLHISSKDYYLDMIANELGLEDASSVLISRNVGKASSETRLFFATPKSYHLDSSSDLLNGKESLHYEGSLNVRASYLSGQDIFGDAILASVGYTWKSKDLFFEDITVRSYYRMLLSKTPGGIYKLSREAILAAELPLTFTTKANWRGSLPRDMLCMFCRQHCLSEPVFSPSKALSEPSECVKVESTANAKQSEEFKCEVKLLSKCGDLIIKCSPEDCSKKQNDAIQKTCLKLILWLNEYFKNINFPFEKLYQTADSPDIQIDPKIFFKEFAICQSLQITQLSPIELHELLEPFCMDVSYTMLKIEGPDSGVCPSNGSIPCISYSVSLVVEGDNIKEVLEVCDEFEFEIGVKAVISYIEEVVMQMSAGQSACFTTNLPSSQLILASAGGPFRIRSLLSSKSCCLEYEINLTKVTEPLEERMEQALFSPPLSKQRVEFAVQHIKESCAATLVDFGCGSGSLLDALLNYPSSLNTIVGVDISQKGLTRAAKVLHSKLGTRSDAANAPWKGITSVILYEGSITDFDSRLHGFDIGTCLEVIEHMEEDQASVFGNAVLSYFRPRILIVSTPNFEYNVVLQRSNPTSQGQEEESDEKTQLQSCKFRNYDHKFEWTREQFNRWASDLAARHNYSVEFSGVGGAADIEPGFASQIAVFKREAMADEDLQKDTDSEHHYRVVWDWSSSSR
ncbi:hypothetical protein L6164_033149 [Bauhinia variegata]|uniref:Uncharacterized protein n=1 Tax=Bauhinia variegata TaxID=167791 RepID=A0ACB9KR86_BAUVA|nr:hypothetical protein L6164_033149 [Bauhinia variegata]